MSNANKIVIIMGSDSDWQVMKPIAETLKKFDVGCSVQVASAHRTPERLQKIIQQAEQDGVKIFIAGAGGAAHLAGVIASHTVLPVIAVPVNATSMNGLDSLLATVQMPSGIPVATMAINGAKNAALFALQILSLSDETLAQALKKFRQHLADEVEEKNARLQKLLNE